MDSNRIPLSIIVFLLAMSTASTVFGEAKYITIMANGVNLRAGPNTSSPVVAKAWKGDVFEFHGKDGKWYRLRIFSVNWRYVHRSLAEVTPYVVSTPNQSSIRREIFRALMKAEDRAEAKADQKYPLEDKYGRPISSNTKKNLDYMWVLSDRYKLEVMHRFRVQPPIYNIVLQEGIKKNW